MKNKNDLYTITFVLLLISTILMIIMGTFSYITLYRLLGNTRTESKRLKETEVVTEDVIEEGEEKGELKKRRSLVNQSVFDLKMKN